MTTRVSVTIASPSDRQKVARWAADTENGTVVTFRKKSRSTEQSAKMWAMLHEVSEQVEWYGQKIDAEDWKDMFTASLRHARVVPGIDKGTFVPLGMRTSTMTIEEMTNLIELIYAFGADHNVIFKDPKPDNTDTDETALSQSVDAGMKPVDEAGADDSPASDAPASTIPDDVRKHFIDFARKALKTAGDDQLTTEQRTNAIDDMVLNYRDVIPESLWSKLSGVHMPIQYVLVGKRTIDQARSYIAKDLLDCNLSDLGGVDG